MPSSLSEAYSMLRSGTVSVSPAVAAHLIGADAAGIRLAAKRGGLTIPHFFTGRNLHLSLAGIIIFMQGGAPVKEELLK